jgi:hypothetical protein
MLYISVKVQGSNYMYGFYQNLSKNTMVMFTVFESNRRDSLMAVLKGTLSSLCSVVSTARQRYELQLKVETTKDALQYPRERTINEAVEFNQNTTECTKGFCLFDWGVD